MNTVSSHRYCAHSSSNRAPLDMERHIDLPDRCIRALRTCFNHFGDLIDGKMIDI